MPDSDYASRKAFFDSLLTIYGRKPVLEALQQPALPVYKLHLADSNRPGGIVADILRLAEQRGIAVEYHDRRALSRISRNAKQDQGVALDLNLDTQHSYTELLGATGTVIALDRITNPQNLGMIARSVCASGIRGLLLPRQGCASLSPLVIKASAGTLLRTPIFHCEKLDDALAELREDGYRLSALSSHAEHSLFEQPPADKQVYVLGNETEGVDRKVLALCQNRVRIPMHNGVESLNVAVTAALIAFLRQGSQPG